GGEGGRAANCEGASCGGWVRRMGLIDGSAGREGAFVEASLEEQRVFAGIDVVTAAPPHFPEAKSLVEPPRLDVARADLEKRATSASRAVMDQQGTEEEPADPLAAPGWVDSQIRHVDLV